MSNKLYNIIVPVDFSNKNKWAISKAIEIANTFHCNIHFVHVIPSVFFWVDLYSAMPYNYTPDLEIAQKKLKQLKDTYNDHLCGGAVIEISVLQGNARKQLKKYIEQYEMDLVVTGLSKFNLLHRIISTLSIGSLTAKINIPVLAIRSSGLISHFKKIILPVHEHIPIRRIRLAVMLGRMFKSTIYLVSLRNTDNTSNEVINKTIEVIQSLTTLPIQTIIMEGKSLAKCTLDFSRKINADLIMINPIKEFFMPGFVAGLL